MSIRYRRYKDTDLAKLATICGDRWELNHLGIAKSLINSNDVEQCFVAFDGDNIVGYVYGFVLPNKMLIPEFLYVLPSYRNKGIGSSLLKRLEDESGCMSSMIFYNKELHTYYEKQDYIVGDNLEVALKQFSNRGDE